MATFQIPVRNDTFNYNFDAEIEGVVYKIKIDFNDRLGLWVVAFNGQFDGIPLVNGIDLLEQLKYLEVPQGKLEISDLEGLFNEANIANFGETVILKYNET